MPCSCHGAKLCCGCRWGQRSLPEVSALPSPLLALQYGYSTLVSAQNEAGAAGLSTAAFPRAGLPWGEELAVEMLSSYTSSHHLILVLVQAVHVQDSFPSLFWYFPARPAQELPPFPCPHPCSGSELAAVVGGTGAAPLQPPSALGFWFLTWLVGAWHLGEREGAGSLRRGVPMCRQGHLPTCTDIFYRHGCICVDNMVF